VTHNTQRAAQFEWIHAAVPLDAVDSKEKADWRGTCGLEVRQSSDVVFGLHAATLSG